MRSKKIRKSRQENSLVLLNKSKKGQFFAIYLVLLTLFMCGMAIWIYYMQKDKVDNSLASPVTLLDLQDKQELFNLQERSIILVSAKESGFTVNGDIDAFKLKFFDYVMNSGQQQFRDFIFSNIAVDGKPRADLVSASDAVRRDFLENTLYSFTPDNGNLKVERRHLGKTIIVRAPDKSVINFMVFVDYAHDESYTITKEEMGSFGG